LISEDCLIYYPPNVVKVTIYLVFTYEILFTFYVLKFEEFRPQIIQFINKKKNFFFFFFFFLLIFSLIAYEKFLNIPDDKEENFNE